MVAMGSDAQQELGSSTTPSFPPPALHGAALGSTCTALAKRVISSPRCLCSSCLFIASRVPASLDQDKAELSALGSCVPPQSQPCLSPAPLTKGSSTLQGWRGAEPWVEEEKPQGSSLLLHTFFFSKE